MGNDGKQPPKVFISYAHGDDDHISWVVDLASRLRDPGGVHTVLDKWDLEVGHDAQKFMEQMVTDISVEFVLLICDQKYKQKANDREGGVGTESQIISPAIYKDTEQTKFIPIVKERDEKGDPYIPVFISSRIYIDLSDPETYEEKFEHLVRHLWRKPALKKPPVSRMPSYLEDEVAGGVFQSKYKIKRTLELIEKDSKQAPASVKDALEAIVRNVSEDKISYGENRVEFDEVVMQSINRLRPLVELFVELTDKVCRSYGSEIPDMYSQFIELLIELTQSEIGQSSYEVDFDNFRFIRYELSLYLISILLKHEKYSVIFEFVNRTYFYQRLETPEEGTFMNLRGEIKSLNNMRNQRLRLDRASVVADEIKRRATFEKVSFYELQEAECVLYALTLLKTNSWFWWPTTLVYWDMFKKSSFFFKLRSQRFFDKAKVVFGVTSVDELKSKVETAQKEMSTMTFGWDSRWVPSLSKLFKFEEISTRP